MNTRGKSQYTNPVAAEIDHLGEDLLDTAASIERLTRQFSAEMQALLQRQAESIKAFAEACEQNQTPKH